VLLRKYNKDSFHLQHALTVEGVMRWYAEQLGFADEVDFWGIVGLLHLFSARFCPKKVICLKIRHIQFSDWAFRDTSFRCRG